jgi:DNA-binding NarL/FixJ family response regulator
MARDRIDTDPSPCADPPDLFDEPDEIAIERALAGDGMRLEHLTIAEQNEVVRRLTERGKSIRDIAEQLATTKRTVSRRRLAAHAA